MNNKIVLIGIIRDIRINTKDKENNKYNNRYS